MHERSSQAASNFAATLPPLDFDLPQQLTKDPYIFDFVAMTDRSRERELDAQRSGTCRSSCWNLARALTSLANKFDWSAVARRSTICCFTTYLPAVAWSAVMPGRVGGGWVTSLILGVVGAIVGGWIGDLLFNNGDMPFWHLGAWLLAIVGGLVVAGIYGVITGRNKNHA